MSKVEYTANPETGAAAFMRVNRFILAGEGDIPNPVGSQSELAQAYATQAERWGWPVTFPEPIERGGELLYPVLRFGTNDRDGSLIYLIESWRPMEFTELTLAEPSEGAQAETPDNSEPEPINPAKSRGAKDKPTS